MLFRQLLGANWYKRTQDGPLTKPCSAGCGRHPSRSTPAGGLYRARGGTALTYVKSAGILILIIGYA